MKTVLLLVALVMAAVYFAFLNTGPHGQVEMPANDAASPPPPPTTTTTTTTSSTPAAPP